MAPSSRSSGQQYKISPPGTKPRVQLCSWVPFCTLSHLCHTAEHTNFLCVCALVGEGWTEKLAPAGLVRAEKSEGEWTCLRRLLGSPRLGLMAPHGPNFCCWSDGLLHYEATGPGAHFHIPFNLSLSNTPNDFPNIGKREFSRREGGGGFRWRGGRNVWWKGKGGYKSNS